MRIFCLIPALNEKGNLTELTSALYRILPKMCSDFLIFFIIQGNDGSINLLKKLKLKYKKIGWQYYPYALGIGCAYKTGFNQVNSYFTHALTLDADLNHDPAVLPRFIDKMKRTNADLVIGSRFVKGGKFADRRTWKKIISRLMNRLITKYADLNIHDLSSGYRLIKRKVIDEVKDNLTESGYPSYMEFVITAAFKGFKIREVPISYKSRVWGKSKMGKFQTMNAYLRFLLRLALDFKKPD